MGLESCGAWGRGLQAVQRGSKGKGVLSGELASPGDPQHPFPCPLVLVWGPPCHGLVLLITVPCETARHLLAVSPL